VVSKEATTSSTDSRYDAVGTLIVTTGAILIVVSS
jgi:hypothetical protein